MKGRVSRDWFLETREQEKLWEVLFEEQPEYLLEWADGTKSGAVNVESATWMFAES